MTKLKKFLVFGITAIAIGGMSITGFAASNDSNIDGSSKIEKFREKRLESKKKALDSRVASGRITQEEADLILLNIEENMRNCEELGYMRNGGEPGYMGNRKNNINSENDKERQRNRNNDERGFGNCMRNDQDGTGFRMGNHMNRNNDGTGFRMGNHMNRNNDGTGFRMGHHKNNR